MEDDYAIAYVADAKVIHSHNYNCTQQFTSARLSTSWA